MILPPIIYIHICLDIRLYNNRGDLPTLQTFRDPNVKVCHFFFCYDCSVFRLCGGRRRPRGVDMLSEVGVPRDRHDYMSHPPSPLCKIYLSICISLTSIINRHVEKSFDCFVTSMYRDILGESP